MLLVLLAPVLDFPIVGDDAFWFTTQPAVFGHDAVGAFLADIRATGDFGVTQTRFATLTAGVRSATMVWLFAAATHLGIAPTLLWSVLKLAHLLAILAAISWFLREVGWRATGARTLRLSPRTVDVISVVLPLLVVLGAKAQIFSQINAWTYYPLQTYQPVIVAFALPALVLRLYRNVQSRPRLWTVPTVVVLALVSIGLNNSYELFWAAVPAVGVVFVTTVVGIGRGRFSWTRGATVIAAAFFATFVALLAYNRAMVASRACVDGQACYSGTDLSLTPAAVRHVVDNVVGSFPLLGNRDLVEREAAASGGTWTGGLPGWSSVVLALAAVALAALLLRMTVVRTEGSGYGARQDKTDLPVLLVVVVVAASVAATAALATGLSARAPSIMEGWAMPYRVGVVVWVCIALAIGALGVIVGRSVGRAPRRVIGALAVVAVTAVAASSYDLNAASARFDAAIPSFTVTELVHDETVRGDRSAIGDARRCGLVEDYVELRGVASYPMLTLTGAAGAFERTWGEPFCSTEPDLADGILS
ncbi:hypothetical protein [Frigoribacterium sp. PvP032]|uniref:hypothetical protein n=1 Tax=Frigoribacterium sp. PvP032 TaxID=2806589 RepID=UPI001AE4EAD4|nr:hypothetical protein [Frigoribacterium sp. PvP032]MBP1190241.1 hypothetical protein [Frigoribacterium sp. PvP032]